MKLTMREEFWIQQLLREASKRQNTKFPWLRTTKLALNNSLFILLDEGSTIPKSLSELKNKLSRHMGFITREWKPIFYSLKSNILSLIGVVIIVIFILIALLAPFLAVPEDGQDPYVCPYSGPEWMEKDWIYPPPTPPSPEHPFGTLDGYDIYYGCIWGTRTAFRVGLLAIGIELVIGLFVGCIAGYHGGLIDELLMRLTDIFFSFPNILLAMIFIVALPAEWSLNLGPLSFSVALSSLEKLAIAISIVGWPLYSRLIRGEIIKVKSEDYVEAARAIGCSSTRTITKHILPNAIQPVLIMAFLDIGGITLVAATLTFLGFGPSTGYAEWGVIINTSRRYLFFSMEEPFRYIYTFLYPTLFLSLFILGWSLVGDALRNIMDPMIRRR